MVRKILCIIVLFLAIASVSAATTEIIVSTYANHNITVYVIKAGGEDVIETFQENSGSIGKLSFSFSTSESKVDISAIARKDGKIVTSEKLDGKNTGEQINIELLKEQDKKQVIEETKTEAQNETLTEETVNETEETTEATTKSLEKIEGALVETEEAAETINETEENEGVTGASVLENKFLPKGMYLIVIIIFIAGGIAFFLAKRGYLKSRKAHGEIKVRKYSEMKNEIKDSEASDEKNLEELEKKMQEIKAEIDSIKESKKNKIKEAEERVKRDLEELKKLKGEEAAQERLQKPK